MKRGDIYVSKENTGHAFCYELKSRSSIQGEPGWNCYVYSKMAGTIYVLMNGLSKDYDYIEFYTGAGFISDESLTTLCELTNNVTLTHPLRVVEMPSRN